MYYGGNLDGSTKYELIQRIGGVKIVVFRGRETQGGRPILLHQLTEPYDHTDVLKRAIEYLVSNPASAGGRILNLIDIQGSPYLVTVDHEECLALREWLDYELQGAPAASGAAAAGPFAAAPPVPSSGPVTAPTPAASGGEPGDFTRRWGVGQDQPISPAQPAVAQAAPARTPLASESQPGEFTRLFQNAATAPSEFREQPLPTAAPPQQQPGEFTRIFEGFTPMAAGAAAPSSAPPAQHPALGAGAGGLAVPAAAPGFLTESLEPRQTPPAWSAAPPNASQSPGEFTRVIRSSSSAPAAAATAPAAPTPVAPASPLPPAAAPFPAMSMPPLPAAPAPPPIPAGPPTVSAGSFSTRPPAVSAPQPAPARPAIQQPILILFGILLIAALALILFVLLRR